MVRIKRIKSGTWFCAECDDAEAVYAISMKWGATWYFCERHMEEIGRKIAQELSTPTTMQIKRRKCV